MDKSKEVRLAAPYISKFRNGTITEAEFRRAVGLKWFRLNCFYYIKDANGKRVLFLCNEAQIEFYENQHGNDTILKGRQMGFTTFKMIHDLDSCLFNSDTFAAGCIAHNDKAAKDIYRNKIRYAYRNIKPSIKALLARMGYQFPKPVNDKDNGYVFDNDSSIGVSTGFRGGTLQSLHVSEFGKICKTYPDRAEEIVTGAFPAASGEDSTITIESTAEGKKGYFYEYCDTGRKRAQLGKALAKAHFKFHFFGWQTDPKYTTSDRVDIPERLTKYFDELEHKHGIALTEGQKHWYTIKEESLGDKMKQEFPCTPDEAFESKIEGSYYADAFLQIYKDGRICKGFNNKAEVHTAWDIGVRDPVSVWFYQLIGNEVHLIDYFEATGIGVQDVGQVMYDKANANGWTYGTHTMPHDARNKSFANRAKSTYDICVEGFELDNGEWFSFTPDILDATSIGDGIRIARRLLARCVFDGSRTEVGIGHLENYRKKWNNQLGCWADRPLHDDASHCADAFRYLAIAVDGTRALDEIDVLDLDF
ncbi:MAG: hypothetical protein ACN2B6_00220 [Rickettsiales bacterium]